jgi:hypothetical protein
MKDHILKMKNCFENFKDKHAKSTSLVTDPQPTAITEFAVKPDMNERELAMAAEIERLTQ